MSGQGRSYRPIAPREAVTPQWPSVPSASMRACSAPRDTTTPGAAEFIEVQGSTEANVPNLDFLSFDFG